MGFGGGGAPAVTPPPPLPPAANPPTMANPQNAMTAIAQRSRAAAAAGAGAAGTITNAGGPQGLVSAETAGRSLLG